MEEGKKAIVKVLKNIFRIRKKILVIAIILVLIFIMLLPAATYFITVDDGTFKEDDWSSTPYAASEYVNNVAINNDGTISSNTTAQELWDKMLENHCRVDKYLKSPEELARLMRAEMVTQYPDTRENPDEKIDWEEIIKNSDVLQGIIKFKRAYSDGNKSTMTYADPETFQSYIDTYNKSGDESAKQKALQHFTLKKASSSSNTQTNTAIAAGEGVMTDVSEAIINATNSTPWPGESLCAQWVDDVYDRAGVGACRHPSAYESFKHHSISTDKSAIPIGAAVYGTGHNSGGCGHIGIYIGDGKVADSQSAGVVVSNMEDWLSWQTDVIDGNQGWLGWGWEDGNPIRGTTEDPNVKQSSSSTANKNNNSKKEEDTKEENVEKSVEKAVDGDGYNQEYISSAGITYKHFKQFQGSYAENPYWDGTIHTSGCGPTSVSILASGLTNNNYTPADIAAQMNSTYGYTGAEPLKGEMDLLGMSSEIIYSPTAEVIQDNLRNGKVMLVSVNSNTIFTSISHIMAIVDINSDGQVYICNPGSSSLYGWYDISEIMNGCQYIVTTNAGAAGIAPNTNNSNYTAVVATWKQVDTTISSDDPNVSDSTATQYTMTTTNINYEEMVDVYTMPFDMLWALLVVGEDKNFVFELADLIYNSDIQITVHDNLVTNTDIDEWHYTQKTKAEVNGTIIAKRNGKTATGNITNDVHDPHSEANYISTKTVVTQTNTVNVALTKADVWIVYYENEYEYVAGTENKTTDKVSKDDGEYSTTPSSTGDSYSCDHINKLKKKLAGELEDSNIDTVGTGNAANTNLSYSEDLTVNYYNKYIKIYDSITNIVNTQRYTPGTPTKKEKIEKKSDEPNFVTIFCKSKYKKNKMRIKDASKWLFEIIEINESTADMLDLIKFLLYKATGSTYDDVDTFDFSIFYPGILTTVGEGDYIVHIDQSSPDIVIKDVEKLKLAFSGYSGSGELIAHAQEFLDLQEKYRVNAVFAAAVSISETSAGRAGHATDGKNNWFNIECTCGGNHGRFETYSSARESIEAFYKQIAVKNYYFTEGRFTVSDIGMVYCENADAPGGWIENTTTFMTQMFQAAGINFSASSSENGEKIVSIAKEKLGCAYVWGASGPNTFDCSGFTMWCYDKIGISISHYTESQKAEAKKVVAVSEARVGDILYRNGHVGIYIGNNQYIHAPTTGDVVKISTGVNTFTHALQFY